MITLEARSADEAWRKLFSRFGSQARVQDGRDQPTKELLHVTIAIQDPRQRIVFARPMNPAFAIAETIWVLAGSDDLSFVRFWNPRMNNFSDDGITLCGAYGYRLGSQPALAEKQERELRHWHANQKPLDQLKMAYDALKHDPESRQVVLQIWDKNSDMPNPSARSKDVPCNLASHLLIRAGRLEWLQVMRSNDFYWGFPYNVIEFTTIQEIVSGWLGVDVGEYVHVSDSLHVYKRHWDDLNRERRADSDIPRNKSDLRVKSYDEWTQIIKRVVKHAQDLTEYRSTEDVVSVIRESKDLPSAYHEWIVLLGAESMRRRNHLDEANKWIEDSGPFLSASWRQWARSKALRSPRQRAMAPIEA